VSQPPTENGVLTATDPVVRHFLDEAAKKHYRAGVLGVRARACWDGPETFTHDGREVVVAPCESTLAVWEALQQRPQDGWLVVLTPRRDDELGVGVLSHFVYQRLRTPDPWQAVMQRFAAVRIDPALDRRSENRSVALGLLEAMPEQGWPPAPGGVLTESHAFHAVLRSRLNMVDLGMVVDTRAVLEWSTRPDATTQLADLRDLVGDALADALIDWIARHCGAVERPVRTLLRAGRVSDLVPLGLVAGLLTGDDSETVRAAGVFQGRYGFGQLSRDILSTWHAEASSLATHTTDRKTTERLADSATTRLRELDLAHLAANSALLPAGLDVRIRAFASEADRVLPPSASDDLDQPLIRDSLDAVESAWSHVQEHHLAAGDRTVGALEATLRLLRWLATSVPEASSLDALMRRHIDVDSWVDSAVNDITLGSATPAVAETFASVLDLVRSRRDAHDRVFATALAATEQSAERGVERVLPEYVIPLAKKNQPVLLLVVDALSMGVATELVAAMDGWVEYGLPSRTRRGGALAALPSLTDCSRCSLLSGELARGSANAEVRGFTQLLKRHGLGDGAPPLFHQKDLEKKRQGRAIAPSVQNAIVDTTKHPLVAAVLNIVDDTLHHADPIGARWDLDAVTHLRPLLEAAKQAGRLVVLTADHGHVLERRDGEYRKHAARQGTRARSATPPPESDEVLVTGPRVLTDDNAAVLAVNERLRYGPLNAGYHGGASPAEVIVPVIALHAGEPAVSLEPVRNVEPDWWRRYTVTMPPRPEANPEPTGLFDVAAPDTATEPADDDAAALAKRVTSSTVFRQQKSIAGRLAITDDRIRTLLATLLATPGRRVPAGDAAAALGIASARLYGAISTIKRILDVEGYVALTFEAQSQQVVLDEAMLREQFGLKGTS
jgi:hypothetical protein